MNERLNEYVTGAGDDRVHNNIKPLTHQPFWEESTPPMLFSLSFLFFGALDPIGSLPKLTSPLLSWLGIVQPTLDSISE